MSNTARVANSQDPYTSNWAAMGLPSESGRTAFDGPLVLVDSTESLKAIKDDLNRAKARAYQKAKYVPAAEREKAITEFKAPHLNRGPLNESPQAKAKTALLLKARI